MQQIAPHFSRHEFACHCGCGFDTIDADTLRILESVRQHFGMPVTVTSAARCRSHNASVGGAARSQHIYGRAADIKVAGTTPRAVHDWIAEQFPYASLGLYQTFVHVDTRTGGPARWRG